MGDIGDCWKEAKADARAAQARRQRNQAFEELGEIARIDGVPISHADTFDDKTKRRFWRKGWNSQDEKIKVVAG